MSAASGKNVLRAVLIFKIKCVFVNNLEYKELYAWCKIEIESAILIQTGKINAFNMIDNDNNISVCVREENSQCFT